MPLESAQGRVQRADDRLDDLVLEREDLTEVPVVPLSPDVMPGGRIDKLGTDPDPVVRSAHAPFDDIARAECSSDLANVDRGSFVLKRGVTANNE